MDNVRSRVGSLVLFTSCIGLLTANPVHADYIGSIQGKGDTTNIHLRGHLKPLGEQRPSEGLIDSVDGFLHPRDFYQNYVFPSLPVVFKGAARELPAYQRWSDTYLNNKYGSKMVSVELAKKEDRDNEERQVPMSQFLLEYTKQDIYMVQDVYPEMMVDIILPKSLQCGGFKDVISMAIVWFSSGGTKSVLHNDDVENINCILDGSKSLVMINKKYQDLIEDEYYNREKAYSAVDVERVNLVKHPLLADVPTWRAEMQKGDCLYIPNHWYHTVASSNTRNLAVNLWFAHLAWFNKTDCDDCCPRKSPLLSTVEVKSSEESIRHAIFNVFEELEYVSLEDAVELWGDIMAAGTVQQVFELLDINKDLKLTWEELFTADVMSLTQGFPELIDYQDLSEVKDEL